VAIVDEITTAWPALTWLAQPPAYYWVDDRAELFSKWTECAVSLADGAKKLGPQSAAARELAAACIQVRVALARWRAADADPDEVEHAALVDSLRQRAQRMAQIS
jgi:mono/diheme cytochrome c family protein